MLHFPIFGAKCVATKLQPSVTAPYCCSLFSVNVGTNPGLAAIWEDERQRRQEANESTQIAPPQSQGIDSIQVQASHSQLIDSPAICSFELNSPFILMCHFLFLFIYLIFFWGWGGGDKPIQISVRIHSIVSAASLFGTYNVST